MDIRDRKILAFSAVTLHFIFPLHFIGKENGTDFDLSFIALKQGFNSTDANGVTSD